MKKLVLTAAHTAVLMSLLTLISKLIGLVREMVMANFFGTSFVTDAYAMSFTILTVLFGGMIAAISTAYMPIYSKILENGGKIEGDQFTSRVINLLFVLTAMISILGIAFSEQIITVFASGFSGETAKLASFFVKVLFSYVIFSSTTGILESYLQYKGVFLPQIISGYIISICIIVVIVVSAYTSYYYLAFGMLVGYALRFVAMIMIAKRCQFQYSFSMKLDHTFKQILSLAVPTFIGSYMLFINQFVDKTLASRLNEGSIAALNYAWLLNNMIMGVTITVLATIIYPKLTHAHSAEQNDRFNDLAGTGFNIVIMIALPCSLGAMIFSNEVVQIVYERGAFDTVATLMTSSAFFFYSMGLLFMSVNDLLVRVYYSICDMKTPMIFAVISVIINIVLSLILIRYMGYCGLALATSIASLCNSSLLYTNLKRKYHQIVLVKSFRIILKIALAAIISTSLSVFIYRCEVITLNERIASPLIQLIIPVALAGLTYLGLLKALKIEEVRIVESVFRIRK